MEEDITKIFRKIVKTLSAGILWLLVNMSIGIYFGWMFFYASITIGNIIFYVFMLSTLVFLIYYLKKVWREYV